MFNFTEDCLSKRCRYFRYAFYLISGFRWKSYKRWKKDGEPNPFVSKSYRPVQTERVDFIDIFDMIDDKGLK